MRLLFFQREAGLANKLVPFGTTLIFVLLSVVPWRVPGFAVVTPSFAVMAVYHWTIYRPDLLPPVAIFALGLLLDLLHGTPYLGISSLTLLIARTLLLGQRRFFVDVLFPVLWAGFLLVAAGVFAFEWGLVSLLHGALLGPGPFAFETVLTVVSFPIASYLLTRAQRALLARV